MPVLPSKLWKDMPPATRLTAADAFWRDDQGGEQQAEAIVFLARRLNFRPKALQSLAVERRAKMLAQASDIPDTVATRALISYHFATQRPLMAAFLDALGIAHEDGLIAAEDVPAPDPDKLKTAVEAIRASFPADDVGRYLDTLVTLDGDTWAGLGAAGGT